jgi:hypothetical protein
MNFARYDKMVFYSKSSILMLQIDTVAKYFRLELAEIGTWKQINNGRLTPMRLAAHSKYRTVKSNYPMFFFRNLYEMYFRHTVLCTTSDYIWKYVVAFCKGAEHFFL